MAYGSRLQRSEKQERKAGETNGNESVDKRMHYRAMQQAAETSGNERTLDEPTIDELLDDGNWNQGPVAASADSGTFEERVALAEDTPTEELISPELLFPNYRAGQEDGDDAAHRTDLRGHAED